MTLNDPLIFQSNLPFRAHANLPIIRVETLTVWHQSRLIGALIINRHISNDTWDALPPGATAVLYAIANVLGVMPAYGSGLVFQDAGGKERELIAKVAKLEKRSTYEPIRQLVDAGAMRCRRTTKISRKTGEAERVIGPPFELLIPQGPLGVLSNEEEIALFFGTNQSFHSDTRAPEMTQSFYSDRADTREPLTEPDLRAPGMTQSFYSDRADTREPLTEPDLRAPGMTQSFYSDTRAPRMTDASTTKFAESDSGDATRDARAQNDGAAHDVSYLSLSSMDDEGGKEEKGKDLRALLSAIQFDGRPLDPAGIGSLLGLKSCTEERIAEAFAIVNERIRRRNAGSGKCSNPHGAFFALVRDGPSPSDLASIRKSVQKSTPRPEFEARRKQQETEDAAREELAKLGDAERRRRMLDLSDRDSGMWKMLWKANAAQPAAMLTYQMVVAVLRMQPIKPAAGEVAPCP